MEAKTAAFESPEFGTLSVIFSDSGPWFFGKSVANALRMRDSMYRKSLKGVKEENRKRAGDLIDCEDPAMKQWIFINEEGADRLIRDYEDKPHAMLFRDWMWSQTRPRETPPDFEEDKASSAPREITPADEAAFAGNPILKFTNEMFGEVRVVEIDVEPWFIGKDVAETLGYTDIKQAIRKHVDDDDKGGVEMTTPGGRQKVIAINESGLYSLILLSKLPTAREFKYWITSEVLPYIRKHGAYLTDEVLNNILADPDFGIHLLTEIKEECERNRVLTEESGNLPRPTTFPLNSPWSGTAGAC